jgi:hypothetical protein
MEARSGINQDWGRFRSRKSSLSSTWRMGSHVLSDEVPGIAGIRLQRFTRWLTGSPGPRARDRHHRCRRRAGIAPAGDFRPMSPRLVAPLPRPLVAVARCGCRGREDRLSTNVVPALARWSEHLPGRGRFYTDPIDRRSISERVCPETTALALGRFRRVCGQLEEQVFQRATRSGEMAGIQTGGHQ